MSKHYEERYYVRDEIPGDYEEHRRSSSRRRSTSRSRHRMPVAPEEQYYRQRLNRSGSGSSISSISDYEYRTQCVTERPLVRVPRDVIRAPTPPPVIQRVVERAPTPEPDVVERVIVRPQPQQLIERIIERPRTPPPKIIDKEICEPAPPPIVRTRIVKVDHSPRHYANNNPIRYVQQSSRPTGLCNYGPCTDYDYLGYDRSYSTSYSTSELFQPSAQQASAYTGGGGYTQNAYHQSSQPTYQTTQMPQMSTANLLPSQLNLTSMGNMPQGSLQQQQTFQLQPSSAQMSQQAMPMSQNAYGFTYGYRPANLQPGYSAPQQAPIYPRQF